MCNTCHGAPPVQIDGNYLRPARCPECGNSNRRAALRYDYGWSERAITDHLGIAKTVIHEWTVGNSNGKAVGNSNGIKHLEGVSDNDH